MIDSDSREAYRLTLVLEKLEGSQPATLVSKKLVDWSFDEMYMRKLMWQMYDDSLALIQKKRG